MPPEGEPGEQMPPDPMSALAAGAAQQHEMFMAYVTAGFSRAEALAVLIAIITAGMSKGGGGSG